MEDEDKDKGEKSEVETKKEEEKSKGKSGGKLLPLIIIAILVLVGLGILGRMVAEKFAGAFLSRLTGGQVNVEKGGGKVTLKGQGGEFSFEEGGKLPAGFPSDFPTYPGAKLTGSWTAKKDTGEGISVVWETADPVSKVSEYYNSQLSASGWKETTTFNSSDSSTFSFEKGDKSGFVGIARSGDKTTISVTLGAK